MLVFKPLLTFFKVRCSSRKEALIVLVTLGEMIQMEMILFASLCPRKPRQFGVAFWRSDIANIFAKKLCQLKYRLIMRLHDTHHNDTNHKGILKTVRASLQILVLTSFDNNIVLTWTIDIYGYRHGQRLKAGD